MMACFVQYQAPMFKKHVLLVANKITQCSARGKIMRLLLKLVNGIGVQHYVVIQKSFKIRMNYFSHSQPLMFVFEKSLFGSVQVKACNADIKISFLGTDAVCDTGINGEISLHVI